MNEQPSSQPDSSPDLPTETKSSKTPWVLLLPLALLGGALWMRGSTPQPNPADNQVTVIATPAPARPIQVLIFTPDENADLRPRVVTVNEALKGKEAAFAAVEKVLETSPGSFPKGAKVLGLMTQGDVVQVNFNRAFADEKFWQGSTRTTMGTYSIVNTLTRKQNDFSAKKVQFLIENKPMELLGELDVSQPLEADMTLVKN